MTRDQFRFRRGLTWLTGDPNAINPGSILSMIQADRFQELVGVQSVVLLATPSLAHFLELDVFMRPLMNYIYSDLRTKTGAQELRVKSVAAVVDVLPEPPAEEESNGHPATSEGLALLFSSASSHGTPNYLTSPDESEAITLEFSSSRTPVVESKFPRSTVRHVTLPVANTIFVNGNRTTLLEDSWEVKFHDSAPTITHQGRRPLKSFQIDMNCSPNDFLSGSVPLKPLTGPRKVVRSMGNVLAQIEVDGKPVPASRELEKAVTQYTSSHPTRAYRGPIQVFALVRPPGSSHSESHDTRKDEEHTGSILAELWQDARLFKVTGGGGGWGKKQGLLSLDTAVDFGRDEATVGFPDFETALDLSHNMGSHGMIPQDGTVQFFLYTEDAERRIRSGKSSHDAVTPAGRTQNSQTSFILGTASNPDTQEYPDIVPTEEKKSGGSFYPNLFGMASYGGAALRTDKVSVPERAGGQHLTSSRTRLDVPDSRFVLRALPESGSSLSRAGDEQD
ncbi:hypothetical protein A1O1_06792 [Capronia coronata CBS 617.96]|uniref:Uncharacterized protein n=1 Tax=Capronia coronata CBS 617.96 TaxID=1182541 RepID=W9XSF8_9EURO|nr:uncharacterized protein A1O1_06792 [Capronia coronata CBS 617.96]EXJ83173.1 hypothetical protein A1O1_06792 [Capronia coronata CBS 617.96]